MILDCEQGSFPSNNPDHSGIWYKYYVGDEDSLYGVIRYEIIPDAAIVHVYPVSGITKSKLLALKETNFKLLEEVIQNIWKFEDVYFVTPSLFLVKLFSNGKYKQMDEVDNVPIYKTELKDVLCPKQQPSL